MSYLIRRTGGFTNPLLRPMIALRKQGQEKASFLPLLTFFFQGDRLHDFIAFYLRLLEIIISLFP